MFIGFDKADEKTIDYNFIFRTKSDIPVGEYPF